jgi:hypothetical protein
MGVLLLVVLWIFPRPFVHSHEAFENSSSGAITLEEHLKGFHPQGSLPDNTVHVHWVLNNGSILLASCDAPSPTIITSLSSHDISEFAYRASDLRDAGVDLVATQCLSLILSINSSPSRKVPPCSNMVRATFEPTLLSLSCLLAC